MTNDELFAWVMHRFSEVFEDHAILKGGMALRLLDSPRSTVDIDYVFVPFESKKDIAAKIESVLRALDGAVVKVSVHSTMVRAELRHGVGAILVEASVMMSCSSIAMATAALARTVGRPSQIVRIMEPAVALAHKIAAWNERRLLRDLYDAYFFLARAKVTLHVPTLDARLGNVQSRLPALRRTKTMTRDAFADALASAIESLNDERIRNELGPLLPPEELAGLAERMKVALSRLEENLRSAR
ncbi:MAG: nucleotidyl transferase AbiEii/AbiGii toxin family protein [Deltaproteobacteria bacterium]|nr:nucleotidyl transferase AbiEii/AbiGii toxin family protein [Deltaproteobacteria bacterium]